MKIRILAASVVYCMMYLFLASDARSLNAVSLSLQFISPRITLLCRGTGTASVTWPSFFNASQMGLYLLAIVLEDSLGAIVSIVSIVIELRISSRVFSRNDTAKAVLLSQRSDTYTGHNRSKVRSLLETYNYWSFIFFDLPG